MVQGYESAGLRRRRIFKKAKIYGALLLFFILLLSCAYAVYRADVFKIKKYTWVGVFEHDQPALLSQLKLQIVSHGLGVMLGADNYFSWSTASGYHDVVYPQIKIEKHFSPAEIIITAAPRNLFLAWCSERLVAAAASSSAADLTTTDCVWADEQGIAFEAAPLPEGQLVFRVDETSAASVLIGEAVVEPNFYKVTRAIMEKIRALHLTTRQTIYNPSLQQLEITTMGGTLIKFSVRFDPNPTALPALERFIEKPGLSTLDYVDLTVENRAFYKLR